MTQTPSCSPFSARFVRTAQMFAVLFPLVAGACASRPREHRAAWARNPAVGRPSTCPDHPVDVWGDGTPGPNDLRCSYEGTAGGQLVQLQGIVTRELEGQALGQHLEGQRIQVFRIKNGAPSGDPLGQASTDAQGRFSLGVVLRPGTYAVRVVDSESSTPAAERWVEISSETRNVRDVALTVAGAP